MIVIVLLVLSECVISEASDKKKPGLTSIELQKKIMTFADMYVSLISEESHGFYKKTASEENYQYIRANLIYSQASAFLIAADPMPKQALLDMVVMITLGHRVIKEKWYKEMGPEILPLVHNMALAEKHIWEIAGQVLSDNQIKEFRVMIDVWRRQFPDINAFSYIRFQGFSRDLEQMNLTSKKKKKRTTFFSSLTKDVATEVEQTRLLAERSVYLASRLPLMAGGFMDVWISILAKNPDSQKILADISTFADVSGILASTVEKLPEIAENERKAALKQLRKETEQMSNTLINRIGEEVTRERISAIDQISQSVASERNHLIQEFETHEKPLREIFFELNQTFLSGTEFVKQAESLLVSLGDRDHEGKPTGQPFDIKEYQIVFTEAAVMIDKANLFIENVDTIIENKQWQHALENINTAVDRIGSEGDERIDHFFYLGFFLIAGFLTGLLIVLIIYRYICFHFFSIQRS